MSSARAFQSGNIFCESEATHNTLVTVTESEADTVRTQDDPPISEDSSKRDTIVDSEAMLSDMPIGSPEASSGSIQMDDSREDAVEVEEQKEEPPELEGPSFANLADEYRAKAQAAEKDQESKTKSAGESLLSNYRY